ncbi:MAG: hypothetical protein CSA35_07780 [Dethiosulfovibrio peptidovorans]|nr:MAG: hypothetical protein CSA35_07780 [Dethiosulfovibrio peptidovorans]
MSSVRRSSFFLVFVVVLLGSMALIVAARWALPEDLHRVENALPALVVRRPYGVFIGQGAVWNGAVFQLLINDLDKRGIGLSSVGPLLRVIPLAERAACMVTVSSSQVEVCAAFRFCESVQWALSDGFLSAPFRELWGDVVSVRFYNEGRQYFALSGAAFEKSLYATLDGDLVLLASSRDLLSLMLDTLYHRKEIFSPVWMLEPLWDSHLEVRDTDGGFHGAWCLSNDEGVFEWYVQGIDHLKSFWAPRRWDDFLPEVSRPLSSMIGIAQPHRMVVTIGGQARLLSAPFPGMSVTVWGDGPVRDGIHDLWQDIVSSGMAGSCDVDLGGDIEVPFPMVVRLEPNRSFIALGRSEVMDSLMPRELDDVIPGPWRLSLLWGHVEGALCAKALEGMIKSEGIVFPSVWGQSPFAYRSSLIALTRWLRSVGTLSFVVPEIDRGILLWKEP